MSRLLVHNPGFLTTVQDAGRPGQAHLGISASGAADGVALRIGNWLVGNAENAAALEMTLVGGTFEFDAEVIVSLTGSSFEAAVEGISLEPWRAYHLKAGSTLKVGPTHSGARCYLCVRGGFDVPKFLGSASTHLFTGLGGYEGRPLKKGDELVIGTNTRTEPVNRAVSFDFIRRLYASEPLRVTWGPQRDFFPEEAQKLFLSSKFHVLENSNRMGLRLHGPVIQRRSSEMITEGTPLGAIQIPQDGQPIILFVEHQTTGGYPKIANVIAADIHRVGQLRPRDKVQFALVTFEQARRIHLDQEAALRKHLEDLR
ncbi:MAG TPA: biotin-dependent carboxyltransferase family protein [Bacteroidota bacterium]|nr:biotin-dependent carboxyltransferase family protein [Bacteroidota bacterium]